MANDPRTCPYAVPRPFGKLGGHAQCLRPLGPCLCGLRKGSPTDRLPVPPAPGLGLTAAQAQAGFTRVGLLLNAVGEPVLKVPPDLPPGVYTAFVDADYSQLEARVATAYADKGPRCPSWDTWKPNRDVA